jgi:hypothetical protein
MALSCTIASAIGSVQRMPERSIRSLIRFLQGLWCKFKGETESVRSVVRF